jgi:hypothetical protein
MAGTFVCSPAGAACTQNATGAPGVGACNNNPQCCSGNCLGGRCSPGVALYTSSASCTKGTCTLVANLDAPGGCGTSPTQPFTLCLNDHHGFPGSDCIKAPPVHLSCAVNPTNPTVKVPEFDFCTDGDMLFRLNMTCTLGGGNNILVTISSEIDEGNGSGSCDSAGTDLAGCGDIDHRIDNPLFDGGNGSDQSFTLAPGATTTFSAVLLENPGGKGDVATVALKLSVAQQN